MNGNGTWQDAVIDSVLAGAASVVGVLSGLTFAGVQADAKGVLFVCVTAFASAFVFTMQAARGRRFSPSNPLPRKRLTR